MTVLERAYDRAPIFVQNTMVSMRGMLNARSRYGSAYDEHRDFLVAFDSWPLTERLDYQRATLVTFLEYVVERSPFYRRLYRDIDLSAVRSVEDLRTLPSVEKETLRAHMSEVMTIPKQGAVEGHTGGTSGKSLVVRMTVSDMMKRMATLDHFKARAGFLHREMRRATFNGKHIVPPGQGKRIFWRYNASCKQMIFSSFHVTESNLGYYVAELNRFKPHALDGFFSSLCQVASYIERNEISLQFRPVAIFPTSETLTPQGRELLTRVFGCPVFDQYASSEGAPFIVECTSHSLHVCLSSGVFETMDGSDELLVTSFTTHGTPLVRYRIGDRMVFDSEARCTCGDPSPIVRRIEGRQLEFLYSADGAKINSGNVANLFKNMPNALVGAQLQQTRMDEVIALLHVDPRLYRDEFDTILESEFAHKFGPRTRLKIVHVDEIPCERSGKRPLIKNDLASDLSSS